MCSEASELFVCTRNAQEYNKTMPSRVNMDGVDGAKLNLVVMEMPFGTRAGISDF